MESTSQQSTARRPEGTQGKGGGELRLVKGRTMRDALLAARRDLGARAVVVDQRTAPGGVSLVVSDTVPRSTQILGAMRQTAARMLEPTTEPAAEPEPAPARKRTPLAEVERRLREHGGSPALRESVLEGVCSLESDDSHPLDLAAKVVGEHFSLASLPAVAGETAVISMIGQSGTGKTTTVAKLASRLVRAGRRVALATLDAGKIGVEAQLRAFGTELRIPTISLDDPARLAAELGRVPGRLDVLLIDGSGDERRDIAALQAFEDHCRASGARTRFSTLLVLSATASEDAIRAAIHAAESIEPVGAVITKVDEAERPLPALEQAREAGLGLAFLTNGPDLAPHFHRARPERVADVALLGRIA